MHLSSVIEEHSLFGSVYKMPFCCNQREFPRVYVIAPLNWN
jgi:hypothetical protein